MVNAARVIGRPINIMGASTDREIDAAVAVGSGLNEIIRGLRSILSQRRRTNPAVTSRSQSAVLRTCQIPLRSAVTF